MPPQLWFLRHGEAEPHDARPDARRRLTAHGESQSRTAGLAFAALGIEFAAVFTSPRRRALDTARLAGVALGLDPVVEVALSAGFDEHDARTLAGADARPILLVGHEPDFSQAVHDLTGARVKLRKGGVAAVSLGRGRAELVLLMTPRELAAVAAPSMAAGQRDGRGHPRQAGKPPARVKA